MDAEEPEEGEQYPSQRIIDPSGTKPQIRLPVHGGNQEEIEDPPDEQQPQREKVNGPGDGFSVIEAVGTREPEDPQYVAQRFAMGVGILSQRSTSSAVQSGGHILPIARFIITEVISPRFSVGKIQQSPSLHFQPNFFTL
jgi:hypothetical protein